MRVCGRVLGVCRRADTFGIPTRCHVVAGDVKQAWDKPGVTYARPVSTAGSNLASSVRGAYSSGFADLASRPQPCILTWIGTSIFHGTAHRALGLVSIAIGARVVQTLSRGAPLEHPRIERVWIYYVYQYM